MPFFEIFLFTLAYFHRSLKRHSAGSKNIRKLQIAQNKVARVALNCSLRTNISKMHEDLSWLLVENRLKLSILAFITNVIND